MRRLYAKPSPTPSNTAAAGDPTKFVQCSVVFEADHSVLIVVSDPGPGFDPKLLADPTEGEHLHKNHGRGIYLIHHLMDEVSFQTRRRGDSYAQPLS